MLNRLVIRNYALIDSLDISFSKNLNIITGETGAGKSIILGALSLILGQRTESKYFFNQQKKCIIEGYFKISEFQLTPFFTENDLDLEEETVLRREISADGKSRAFINDTPVNLAILKQLGELLIDIHSQHATLEINNPDFQLLVVDSLAGHGLLLKQYREAYKHYKSSESRLDDLISQRDKDKADQDYFQFQFDELERANLIHEEQEKLETELAALTHAEEIKKALLTANYLVSDQEQAAVSLLKEANNQLQQIEKFDPRIAGLAERLRSSLIEIKDIAGEIEQIEQATHFNENRLMEINERLNVIYNLQKKHRVSNVDELIQIQSELSDKLGSLANSDELISKLEAEVAHLKNELVVISETLSASRNEIIPSLEDRLKLNLEEVGMPNAVLKIENILLDEDKFDINGRNRLRFLFSANKGQEPAPMNKVASGGELSRVMLSIKSLIAKHTALPTIIFDEIDTGISGEVALRVGNLMEKMAEDLQVIAITHLPQIAGKGNAHYPVYKNEENEKTQTNIGLLEHEDRVVEIAKMLSGENPGEFALQHARELLGAV